MYKINTFDMDINIVELVTNLGVPTALLIIAVLAIYKITNKYIAHLEKSNAELTLCLKENTKSLNRNSVIMLELAKKSGIKFEDPEN